eukprot:COSAG06_NODE_29364_length_558_cov_0.629630_1_plen_118_part_10
MLSKTRVLSKTRAPVPQYNLMRRRAGAVVVISVVGLAAVSDAQSPWCAAGNEPTATEHRGGARVGLACPTDTEKEDWGPEALQAWAGHEMVRCTEEGATDRVVRRCNGVNDCAGDGEC